MPWVPIRIDQPNKGLSTTPEGLTLCWALIVPTGLSRETEQMKAGGG
jgi:hypothetical protein